MLYLERAIEMLHGYLFSAFSLFFSVISLLSAYPQAFRLGACNVSGICPFMPCAPVDPNYRESILRVFDDHLRPFVRAFRVGWPLDITADTVRAAMAQCTALEAYVATFPSHDGDRLRILQWLYPPFSLPRPVGKLCYWGSISPLNLLKFALLSMRSRFAGMAAWAWLPFLYDPSRDHLSGSDVLVAWSLYVDRHGALQFQHFVNLMNSYMPQRRLFIESLVAGIVHHRDNYHDDSMLIWDFIRDYQAAGPPITFPYAPEI